MKILGVLPVKYRSDQAGAIVELSHEELQCIVGGDRYATIKALNPGATMEIEKRFRHAQDVLSAAFQR